MAGTKAMEAIPSTMKASYRMCRDCTLWACIFFMP